MNTKFGNSGRTGFFALVTFLTAFATAAQDAPPPAAAPATPPAQAPAADANQQGGRGNRGNNNNNNVQRGNFVGGGFNMDDKQRELLQEARQVNGDDLRKLNEKLAEAQKEFVKVVVAEKYDEKIVREKADAVGKIQAEILALNGKAFATVSPTLKPEQKEILEGNVRIGIALISPDRGFGGGGPGGVNFAVGGGGRGNFPPGGDVGFGGGGGGRGGGARDAGPGQDRNLRRGGNGGPGADGNAPRRRADNPGQ